MLDCIDRITQLRVTLTQRRFTALRATAVACLFVPVSSGGAAHGPLPRGDAPRGDAPREIAAALDTAIFAGGCFWSMERPFEHVPGVVSTRVGYAGGTVEHPTYAQVSTGSTGHVESVQVVFDPRKITYAKLLDVYWHNIDPFTPDGQFCDKGDEYRTVIFYADSAQRDAAEHSRALIDAAHTSMGEVATRIVPAGPFWPAEDVHQHYADRNRIRYAVYRVGCGRDERLRQIWGDSAEPFVPKD